MSQQLYQLKVIRVDDLAKAYIVEFESKLIRVHMVPEQIGKGNPGEVTCTLERSGDDLIISQDMETLLRRHYKEGDEVLYKIERVTNTYYFLRDELGYHTYLDSKYKINPSITPKLRCRIKSINSKRVNVELVEKISLERSQFTVGADKLKSLLKEQIDDRIECLNGISESITSLLLSDNVIGSFDSECHRWIHDICKECNPDKDTLDNIRTALLTVLEESTLLNDSNINEREALEHRFTTLIEQTRYYIHALEFVEQGTEEDTISKMLDKLSSTGFVYHPKKNFYIMMCIFLLKSKDDDGAEFIDNMMPKVFDTLRSCDLQNWKRKPFKLVWIKLLEFFVNTLNNDQDKLMTDRQALYNMVQSLALQYNLTEEDDEVLIDCVLNLSMLYRYCAKVGVIDPMRMLEVAYNTLIGAIQEEPCIISNTSDPDRMVNVIYNQVYKFTPDVYVSRKYEGKDADIIICNDKISIVPKDYNNDEGHDMIPDYLGLWNNLQVSTYSKASAIAKANRQALMPYKLMWHDIEQEMKDCGSNAVSSRKQDAKIAHVDVQYGIIVTKQTAAETPTFECEIVDPADIKGTGTIRMADMVGYPTPSVGLFSFEKNGKPLIFDAYVTKENADGTFRFESKDYIDSFVDEYRCDDIQFTDHLYCIVTGGNTLTSFFAVSESGMSVSVKYAKEDTPFQMNKGTVIEVTCIEAGKPGFLMAQFLRLAPEINISLADAFGNLIRLISNGEVYEEVHEAEEKEDAGTPDVIEKQKVKEIMSIIDSIASLESDYIKAYNYLGYSKMIASIIDDEQHVHYYESKMALIELLYEFDVNDSISDDVIQKFEINNAEFFTEHSTLHRQFRKLQLISFLGKDNHDKELCAIACDDATPDLSQLAQLIISYNFMNRTGMSAQAADVQEHIKELLKLQKKENPKKDYGQETFTKEFKSSIVCPPDSMRPDLPRQTHKIMEEICSFLNAEGGVLYIGVDDKTHLERGIDEDLKNPVFDGSRDKYDVYVRNKINLMLVPGEEADHCVKTYFDEEAKAPVYVIEIKPCPHPVSIDGVFYERRGTSSRHVSEDYVNTFISNRLQQVSSLWGTEQAYVTRQEKVAEIIESAGNAAPDVPVAVDDDSQSAQVLEYSTDVDAIKTSKVRSHRHSNDDIQPDDLTVYVNIFEDNTYSITPQLYSGCLSLGIYDEELVGSLIVVYATGEISKIPLDELLDKDQWMPYTINNKSRIVFVSPAVPGNVLSILYHSKNNDYYRFFSVDKLDHGTFTTCMRPFYSGQIDEIKECDILPLTSINQYKNFIDLDNDKPGADAKKTDGKKAAKVIKSLLE